MIVMHCGQGALLGKYDIKSDFRFLPIFPGDYDLLGFTFGGFIYVDIYTMGYSISYYTAQFKPYVRRLD